MDSIFYATTEGFNYFTHRSEVSEVWQDPAGIIEGLIEQGTDPLQIMTEFGKQNDIEIFWSMRVNDEHDSWVDAAVSQFKKDHPEYLFGTMEKRPPHASWSCLDYGLAPVREQGLRIIEDVCSRYDIDGIEIDFFRQVCCFKRLAWGQSLGQEELDIMSEYLRQVRSITDRIGTRQLRLTQ